MLRHTSLAHCKYFYQNTGFVNLFRPSQAKNKSNLLVPLTLKRVASSTTAAIVEHIPPHGRRMVGRWLLGCAGMCFGAIVIGGITRLTESGLSITQWDVIKGMRPPRTEQEWLVEFDKYKKFPEYKYLERDLTLNDFKSIFYWEYAHRMWGRSIALVFALPAVYFLRKKWISKALKPRLAIYAALLGFQGGLGWYMVKSGLEEKRDDPHSMPRVSQYRLAAHLGSALVLYTLFLWQGLSHTLTPHQLPSTLQLSRLRGLSHGVMALVFFTCLSGALVAGLDAGLVYNSWPLMADRWIPTDLFNMSPKWKNLFENATTVQFNHRRLGELTACCVLGIAWMCRQTALPYRTRMVAGGFAGMALLQVGLGVATLLSYVPVWLASLHQTGAISLLTVALGYPTN